MGVANNRGTFPVPPEPVRVGGVRDLADCQPAAARAVSAGRSLTVPVLSRLFIFNAVSIETTSAQSKARTQLGGGYFKPIDKIFQRKKNRSYILSIFKKPCSTL